MRRKKDPAGYLQGNKALHWPISGKWYSFFKLFEGSKGHTAGFFEPSDSRSLHNHHNPSVRITTS
jgi:hypothetical protein